LNAVVESEPTLKIKNKVLGLEIRYYQYGFKDIWAGKLAFGEAQIFSWVDPGPEWEKTVVIEFVSEQKGRGTSGTVYERVHEKKWDFISIRDEKITISEGREVKIETY
jgi:hypothetical protein